MTRFRNKECQVVLLYGFFFHCSVLLYSEEERKTKNFSKGLSSHISVVCYSAHYKISMVKDVLISPFSENMSVFNCSMHCHCRSSEWTSIISICLCFLALPQSLPRCKSDCHSKSESSPQLNNDAYLWLCTSGLLCVCICMCVHGLF